MKSIATSHGRSTTGILAVRVSFLLVLLFTVGLACAELNPSFPASAGSAAKKEIDVAEHKESSKPYKAGTKEFPEIIEVSKLPVIHIDATEKTEKVNDYLSPEWWLVYVTAILAAITLALAIFTGRLWSSGEKTAKHELRAYLGATPLDIMFHSANHIQALVEIANTGKTPANNVTQAIRMEIRAKTDALPFPNTPTYDGRRPIVPGAKWTFGSELDVSDEQLKQLINKEKVIFVWGRAEYTDVFDKPHYIDFCYQNIGVVSAVNELGGRQFVTWALFPEKDGNEAT